MKKIIIPITMFVLFVCPGPSEALAKYEDSIVLLTVTKKPVDISRPWQFEKVTQQEHLAAVVSNNLILTTAFAIGNTSMLELRRLGNPLKYEAEVVFVDYEVNLALIKPLDKDFYKGLKPLKLGNDINIGSKVSIFRAKDSYQLTEMPGHLSEVGIYNVITSSYSMLAYLIKVQQKGLGWAEPVIKGGQLVGITSGQDSNYIHAIPSGTIKHFLNDSHDNSYRGFPSIGIGLSPLVDPTARKYYGVDGIKGGTRVSNVFASSSLSDVLKKNDVIYEFNGKSLSEHGYYRHPLWGRVHMKYLLNKLYSGDAISLKVYRNGKEVYLSGKVTRYNSNDYEISYNRYGKSDKSALRALAAFTCL